MVTLPLPYNSLIRRFDNSYPYFRIVPVPENFLIAQIEASDKR